MVEICFPVDQIVQCSNSLEGCLRGFSCGAVCFVPNCGSDFLVSALSVFEYQIISKRIFYTVFKFFKIRFKWKINRKLRIPKSSVVYQSSAFLLTLQRRRFIAFHCLQLCLKQESDLVFTYPCLFFFTPANSLQWP